MKIAYQLNKKQTAAVTDAAVFWARDGIVKVEFTALGFALANSAGNALYLENQILAYEGSRHAIWSGNSITDVLTAAGVLLWKEEGNKSWLVENRKIETSGYESQRADAGWWQVGLSPQLVGMERIRAGAEGRI